MTDVRVSSGSPFEAVIGMSRARRIGTTIAVAGTAPLGPDGRTVGVGDVYAQTKRCLEIIAKALGDAGASVTDVIRTRTMLVDVSRWRDAARAHAEVFGEVRPANTVVEVKGFIDPDWLVELEADAVATGNTTDP